MRSLALFTEEIDDLETAVAELKEQFAGTELQAHSAGLLFAHPDTDLQELSALLQESFDLPIIGATTLLMFTMQGIKKEGISLQIFTADDCEFRVGCTDELTSGNAREELAAMYSRLTADIKDEQVKLILAYGNPLPDMVGEDFVEILDDVGRGAPIYGAMASDNFAMQDCKITCGGKVLQHGLSLIAITGRVKPITHYVFDVDVSLDYEGVVTELSGNMVMKLDGIPFAEAIANAGMDCCEAIGPCGYVNTPFKINYNTEDGEEIEMLRHLYYVDKETGGGLFCGKVPLGARVRIGIVTRDTIHDSVAVVAQRALESVKKVKDYKYSSLLITSCASRIMSYTNDLEKDADAYIRLIPEGIQMSGIYAFGEICPSRAVNSSRMRNTFHNTTFSMLVM